MIDKLLLELKSIIQFIEEKRGYGYNGWKESKVMGMDFRYKEYEERIPGAINEFYKKPRFSSENEVHRWIDVHGRFIEYRSKKPPS